MFALLMAVLPGKLHRWIRRRRGQEIDVSATLRFGTILAVSEARIGPGAKLGPFVFVRASRLEVAADSKVGPLVVMSARDIEIGSGSKISPLSVIWSSATDLLSIFRMGDHSQVFPLCWLEPGHGITLGSRVGIGGHGLIFTHGSWANYFRGAPVTFGPVVIEDRVWLPWRVFVMPNVTIGRDAIIGAGSVVTSSIPARAMAAGTPAKVVRDRAYQAPSREDLFRRMAETATEFISSHPQIPPGRIGVHRGNGPVDQGTTILLVANIGEDEARELHRLGISVIDLCLENSWLMKDSADAQSFVSWITRYGVRLDDQLR